MNIDFQLICLLRFNYCQGINWKPVFKINQLYYNAKSTYLEGEFLREIKNTIKGLVVYLDLISANPVIYIKLYKLPLYCITKNQIQLYKPQT